MKNIYKISMLFALCGFMFISCDQDVEDIVAVTNTGISATISFSKITTDELILEDGGVVIFNIDLDNALPFDAVASLDITSNDGSLNSEGVQEVLYDEMIVITAGETSVAVSLTFVDDTVLDAETYTVTLGNFRPSDGNFPDFAEISASSPLTYTIDVVDSLPIIITTTTADVVINFTWAGVNDLDCRLIDASNSNVDTGYSTSPGEMLDFLGTEPDGDYTLSIRPWTVNDSSIAFDFDFVHGTGNMLFSSTLENASGGWSQEDIFLEINKVTSGTDVTYTFTQLF